MDLRIVQTVKKESNVDHVRLLVENIMKIMFPLLQPVPNIVTHRRVVSNQSLHDPFPRLRADVRHIFVLSGHIFKRTTDFLHQSDHL